MARYKIEYIVERNDEEIVLSIEGNVTAEVPAKRSGHPDTWYPAEGGEVEILEIKVQETNQLWNGELTKNEEELVEEKMLEEASTDDSDYDYDPPDYYENG